MCGGEAESEREWERENPQADFPPIMESDVGLDFRILRS